MEFSHEHFFIWCPKKEFFERCLCCGHRTIEIDVNFCFPLSKNLAFYKIQDTRHSAFRNYSTSTAIKPILDTHRIIMGGSNYFNRILDKIR